MKTLRAFLILLTARRIATANEADPIGVANAEGEAVFEVQQSERLFVPYGRYPHAKGLQIFDRDAAETMVRVFNSVPARIGRFFNKAGAPIYRGHPDVPGRPDSNPAAPALGWVQGIAVENDGVSFEVKWNEDGAATVQSGAFRYYSPHWNCRPVKGGIQPVQLLSIGLTNNPRIPVPAIANDHTNDTMKLSAILRQIFGFAENDEPTPEQLDEKATALAARLGELEATAATAATATATANDLTTQLATITAERDEARTQLAAANDAAAAAREARIGAEVEAFVLTGRRTGAQREAVRAELLALANDAELETRLAAIRNETSQMHTQTQTADLGAGKARVVSAANDEAQRRELRREAIASELQALANDTNLKGLSDSDRYQRAFNSAAKKNPNLFPAPGVTA